MKAKAAKSEDVLSTLTVMCNQIFGRDTLPKSYITGKTVKFDISMSKMIVFVQGENVSDVTVTGASGPIGKKLSSASTKYGTKGCGNYKSITDTTLQGMMVTYTDCATGTYTINYKGTATSIEVYYEPNADLDFVFTDASGKTVDPKALYEGDYKVSFGMKDAKTGKLISSPLLGQPSYQGSYSVNGKEQTFKQDKGYNGEIPVSLSMNDTFEAKLTVTYLSGYTISKDSTDFGWPKGGIKVAARPAGELKLEISGGQASYPLDIKRSIICATAAACVQRRWILTGRWHFCRISALTAVNFVRHERARAWPKLYVKATRIIPITRHTVPIVARKFPG